MHGKDIHIGVDVAGVPAAATAAGAGAGAGGEAAAAAAAAAAISELTASTERLKAATGAAGVAAGRATRGFYGLWGAINRVNLGLFDGAIPGILGTIGGLHLLADAALETAAVVIPAGIALASFGVAAVPAVQDITDRMKALMTVTQATSQSVYPMTGVFSQVADAVRPQVYQLFGEALAVINHNTGTFAGLATSAGTVLDQLGARLEVALTSGNGFRIFLANATTDLAKLGDIAGNVGGILGNILKTVPGYAQYMLNFADGITKVAEAVTGTGLVQGLMQFGLSAHGAWIYTGLLATGADKLLTGHGRFPGLLSLASDGFAAAALAASKFGAEGNMAERALGSLSSRLSMAQALPWGWIALGAAALGVLAYKFITAKDAADNFIAAFSQRLGAAPLTQVSGDIASGLAVMSGRLAAARAQMDQFSGAGLAVGRALAPIAPGLHDAGNWFTRLNDAVNGAANSILGFNVFATDMTQNVGQSASGAATAVHDYQAYANEIQTLNRQSVTFHTRLGQMAVAFGGTAAAMGILTAAGITANQMLDSSGKAWAQILVQVNATIDAYRAMSQQTGVLGADMNAMTIAGSEQVTAMANLNKSWDTTIGIVSSGQSAFISFEQALGKGTQSVAGVAAAARVAGASMSGLNAQSLALRAAWQNAYTGGAQVIDALRMMISASPQAARQNANLTQSVKDVGAQLAVEGSKSAATRAELVSLAQEVNPNIKNFGQLTQWLGHTGNAGADLNKRLAAMGVNIQNLAADAAALSGAMQQHIVNTFSLAKMSANGTDAAVQNLAQAMARSGATAAQQQAKLTLFHDLVNKDGYTAQQATALITALTGSIFKIPTAHHTDITVNTATAFSAVNAWLSTLARIPRSITTYMNIVTSGPGRMAHAGGYASGTASATPGFHLTGEHGPELVMFGGGERVVPHDQTSHILAAMSAMHAAGGSAGGGVMEVHSHVHLDGKEIYRSVTREGYKWQTRNSGVRSGLSIPGTKVGGI